MGNPITNIPIPIPDAPEFTVERLLQQQQAEARAKALRPGFDYQGLMETVGPQIQGLFAQDPTQPGFGAVPAIGGGGGGGPIKAPTLNPQTVQAPGSTAQAVTPGQMPGPQAQPSFSIAPGGGVVPGVPQGGPPPMSQFPSYAQLQAVDPSMTPEKYQAAMQQNQAGQQARFERAIGGQQAPAVAPGQQGRFEQAIGGGQQAPVGGGGQQATTPGLISAAPPSPEAQRGGLMNWQGGMGTGLAKIFGGPGTGQLTPAQRQQAGWQGLTQAGLGMIAAGGPKPYGTPPTSGMQQVAAGIERGMQGYQQAAGGIKAGATEAAIREAMRTGNPTALEDAYRAAIAGGDIDTANAIGPILQSMISADASGERDKLTSAIDPLTGERVFYDAYTGEERNRIKTPTRTDPVTGEQVDIMPPGFKDDMDSIMSRFMQNTADTKDVANSYLRVLSATNTLLSHERRKRAAEAAGTEYTVPYAATMAAISSFARLLDPNSVVRTEEFKIVTNQGSLEEKLRNWWEMLTKGTLTESISQSLQDEAYRQTAAQRLTYDTYRDQAWAEGDAAGMQREWLPIDSPFDAALAQPRGATSAIPVPGGGGGGGPTTATSTLSEVTGIPIPEGS